jgi:hypothetical protein
MVKQSDGKIYAYDPDPAKTTEATSRLWISDQPCIGGAYSVTSAFSLLVTDFGGNGKAEIVAGNRIFDAATGKLLIDGDSGNKGYAPADGLPLRTYFPAVADMTGDGFPEYIAGTQVYKVNISNQGGMLGNSMTLLYSIPAQTITGALTMSDGNTAAVDIDLDGHLDVVVLGALNATTLGLFAWNPHTQTVIA